MFARYQPLKESVFIALKEEESDGAPKIYVASLAHYNAGELKGVWLNLNDYTSGDEVMAAIQDFLDSVGTEEYAIHDFEGFPRAFYSEYMGKEAFDQIIQLRDIAEEKDIPMDVIAEWASDNGIAIEDVVDQFSDAYAGAFDKPEDFAHDLLTEMPSVDYVSLDDVAAREAALNIVNDEDIEDDETREAREEEVEQALKDDAVGYFKDNYDYSDEYIVESATKGGWPYFRLDSDKFWNDLRLGGDYSEIKHAGKSYIFRSI